MVASFLSPAALTLARMSRKSDVAVDQIEPAFVGLSGRPAVTQTQVRLRHQLIRATLDPLIGDEGRAVAQVKSLPLDQIRVDVQQVDVADNASRLQREGRARANQSAAADDGNVHIRTSSGEE